MHLKRCSLAGRTCLVTGGAGGIGLALTAQLAAQGAVVHACDNDERLLAAARARIERVSWGRRVQLTHGDVTDLDHVSAWVNHAAERSGPLSVLVNNAAYIRWAGLDQITVHDHNGGGIARAAGIDVRGEGGVLHMGGLDTASRRPGRSGA